jgi:hypothetical protein
LAKFAINNPFLGPNDILQPFLACELLLEASTRYYRGDWNSLSRASLIELPYSLVFATGSAVGDIDRQEGVYSHNASFAKNRLASCEPIKASAVRMYFVPEGQHDSSQARSAWKNATQKSRPVGYGVTGYEGRRRGREELGQDAKQIRNLGLSPPAPSGQVAVSKCPNWRGPFGPQEDLAALNTYVRPAKKICLDRQGLAFC